MPNLLEKIKCDYLGIDEHCQTIDSSFDINTENECISVDFNADFDCKIIAGETCYGFRVWGSSQEMTIKHIKMNVVCILAKDMQMLGGGQNQQQGQWDGQAPNTAYNRNPQGQWGNQNGFTDGIPNGKW